MANLVNHRTKGIVETSMRIFPAKHDTDSDEASILVTTDNESGTLVRVATTDADSQQWWGKLDLTMAPDTAEMVAKCILKQVALLRASKKS